MVPELGQDSPLQSRSKRRRFNKRAASFLQCARASDCRHGSLCVRWRQHGQCNRPGCQFVHQGLELCGCCWPQLGTAGRNDIVEEVGVEPHAVIQPQGGTRKDPDLLDLGGTGVFSVAHGTDISDAECFIGSKEAKQEKGSVILPEVLWGLRPFADLEGLDWSTEVPLPKPLFDINSRGKVFDASLATSAIDLGEWWRCLPDCIRGYIEDAKSRWPLSVRVWEDEFSHDEDWPFLRQLLDAGVALVHPACVPRPVVGKNYRSYAENASACEAVLRDEHVRGLVGSAPSWYKPLWLHPLGAVPKKNGKIRIIHDCSAPRGSALNDCQTYLYSPWASVDSILMHVTQDCALAGIDIQEYYRNIGVNPTCWPLQSYAGADGTVYVDSRLQFGHRMAPEVAMRMSAALSRKLGQLYPVRVVGVMDDFTLIHPDHGTCDLAWSGSCAKLEQLGFHLSKGPGKTEAPSCVKVSLGLEINSQAMTVALCEVKLAKMVSRCNEVLALRKVTRKQLEKLSGFLLWVSQVIYAGRTFCHNILAVLKQLKRPWHRVPVGRWLRSELLW